MNHYTEKDNNKMQMPGFSAESSLGLTRGICRGNPLFNKSRPGQILPMQRFSAPSGLSQPILETSVPCDQDACDSDCRMRGMAVGRNWYGLCKKRGCVCKEFTLPSNGGTGGRGPGRGGGGCTSDLQCPLGQTCQLGQCLSDPRDPRLCSNPDYLYAGNLCTCFPDLAVCTIGRS
jgi:hypothetical protein